MYKKFKKTLSSLIFSLTINVKNSGNKYRGELLKTLNKSKVELQLKISDRATLEKQELENALANIDYAIKNIDSPDYQYIIPEMLFITGQQIGIYSKSIQSIYSLEYLIKLIDANVKVQIPRQSRVFAAQGMKRYVQSKASELWSQEARKNIRISEMSEIVWNITYQEIKSAESDEFLKYYLERPETVALKVDGLDSEKFEDVKLKGVKLFIEAFPDKPEGIKKWLREIAPDEASTRGRDKLK
jgi:hypothetical protein